MSTFRRDQRVVIRRVERISDNRFIGQEGRFLGRAGLGNLGAFMVQVPGTRETIPHVVRATHIEAAAPRTLEVTNAVAPTVDETNAELLVDPKRLQAAAYAHQLLGGPEAHLDDLIGVAEFVLGEHKPVERITSPAEDVRAAVTASLHKAVESLMETVKVAAPIPLEEARRLVAEELSVKELGLRFDTSPDDDVIRFENYGTAYLEATDVDRVIRFLQAAKVVHAAR